MANIHFCAFYTKTPVCFCAHFTLKILDYEFLRSLYYFKVDPDTPTMVKIRQPKEEEK